MLGNVGNVLLVFGPTYKGEAIDGAIHCVMFHGTSNDVQVSLFELDMLDIVGNGDGEFVRA